MKKERFVSVVGLRAKISAFLNGHRKHPGVFKGIAEAEKPRTLNVWLRKFDQYEAKIEKLEAQLKKVREARNSLAQEASKKIDQSRKIAKAMLGKLDAEDFLK